MLIYKSCDQICNINESQQSTKITRTNVSELDNKDIYNTMSVSCFDSNKQLRSILTKYGVPMNISNKFDWNSLEEKPILRDDLTTLVRSIALYCDDVIVNPKDFNWKE